MISVPVTVIRFNLKERHKKRKLRAYCVGCVKTGTHYLADVFGENYRSIHEPYVRFLIPLIAKNNQVFCKVFLRIADVMYRLDMNSSTLNCHLAHLFLELFPKSSRFILTYRECGSWLDSIINHLMYRDLWGPWPIWFQAEFGTPPYSYAKSESALKAHNLPPLNVLLAYWRRRNQFVIDNVPESHLLVIPTDRLFQAHQTIADFLGVGQETITRKADKSFPGKKKSGILGTIDPSYVNETIQQECGSLLETLNKRCAI